MRYSLRNTIGAWTGFWCVSLFFASPARACSVCFGDPESTMTQSIVTGIVVMLGIVGAVLAGIASMIGFWFVRARRLDRGTGEPPARLYAPEYYED
jgi:hypothetical protein